MNVKNGKMPLSSKATIGPSFEDVDFMGNNMKLPKTFVDQLLELGFECRFISRQKFDSLGGYHRRGWKPFVGKDFKQDGRDIIKVDPYLWGSSPDGTINRAEMVVAIRPVSICEKHRAHVQQRTDVQSGNQVKRAAEGIRESAAKKGEKVNISEGYED